MSGYKKFFWLVLISACVFLGCEKIPFLSIGKKGPAPKPPVGEKVVARVGGFFITAEDLNKEVENFNALMTQQGFPQYKIEDREKKKAYLRNELVRTYILYQEALDRRLDKNKDIIKALETAKMSLLVKELVRQEIEKVEVSKKDIEDFYNENKDALKEPEQRKIAEIVTSSEADAKQAYITLLQGGDFAALARQYSKAPTAAKGGDLDYISLEPDPQKRIRFDQFYAEAFSLNLEEGGISKIFKGPEGSYYIIRLDSIKKGQAKSLDDLRDNIKNLLLFEKQQKAISDLGAKLSKDTKVEIFESKVE